MNGMMDPKEKEVSLDPKAEDRARRLVSELQAIAESNSVSLDELVAIASGDDQDDASDEPADDSGDSSDESEDPSDMMDDGEKPGLSGSAKAIIIAQLKKKKNAEME